MKDRKHWIRLKNTIEHFNLPIDTWSIGNAAYQLFSGSKAFVVYSEDFDSEGLSLDVKNEDATPMFSDPYVFIFTSKGLTLIHYSSFDPLFFIG